MFCLCDFVARVGRFYPRPIDLSCFPRAAREKTWKNVIQRGDYL